MVGKYRNNRWAEKEQNILWSSWGGGGGKWRAHGRSIVSYETNWPAQMW